MSENRVESNGSSSRVFAGGVGRYLLPAVIFQSVLMGGGYASGREVVQYGARFGVLGIWNILAIFAGFTLISILMYELARVTKSYNYRPLVRNMIGPIWPLFDVLWIVMAVISIAAMGSAAGEIGQSVLRLPYLVGVGLVIALVAVLTYYGRTLIEGTKSVGTVLVYFMWIGLAAVILLPRWGSVQEVFASGSTEALDSSSFLSSPTVIAAIVTGILYVSYNLPALTTVLFSVDRQRTRKETVGAGVLTGVLAIIPFILTYLCLMAFYPNEEVIGAPVPWLAMLEQIGGGVLPILFAIVVIYTLIETATGFMHALIGRIDHSLTEMERAPLTSSQHALFSGAVLISAALLSQVGIIAIVATGYTIMAYVFLALFVLPLFTVGVYKIVKSPTERNLR